MVVSPKVEWIVKQKQVVFNIDREKAERTLFLCCQNQVDKYIHEVGKFDIVDQLLSWLRHRKWWWAIFFLVLVVTLRN